MGIKSYTTFDINNYFTIEALDDDLSVVFTKDIEFGIDGIGWQKLLANTNSPTINKGQTISFKASIIPLDFGGIGQFVINKPCNLSGNIMSLLWKGNLASFSFYYLFEDCTTIKSADRLMLPATTLASECYRGMFWGCSSLTTAPKLPATTLAYYCYSYMFYGCKSLTTAPELPATTLASGCYRQMFYNCRKLNYIKMLATDVSASDCLGNWVTNITSRGTFVKHPNMTTLSTGTSGIPSGWTVVNDGEE